jgi:hypothetical protein
MKTWSEFNPPSTWVISNYNEKLPQVEMSIRVSRSTFRRRCTRSYISVSLLCRAEFHYIVLGRVPVWLMLSLTPILLHWITSILFSRSVIL